MIQKYMILVEVIGNEKENYIQFFCMKFLKYIRYNNNFKFIWKIFLF